MGNTDTYLSKLTLPVNVEGTVSNVEFNIKDTGLRDMIEGLGAAIYWMGVTTTALTDGATTNPVTINGESVEAVLGGMVSYSGSEFVWNGSAWQELGRADFGDLAFKSSASGSYTPAGTVAVDDGTDTTASLTPMGSMGTLSSAYFTVADENATFTFDAGSLPTAGTAVNVVTASGTRTATFTGTTGTVTVE